MGQFVNNVSSCVTESLEGVALGSFGNLVLVRDKNVVLLNPKNESSHSNVAIVCGGGSGHEPAHSSFVNHLMLSAAICGDVFASPSVGAIIDGIRTLVGNNDTLPKAVLVIVKNYTGDKINFGMACEILSSEGILLKKLIVSDDVSLSDIKDRRGVAGTVLVYKIAGALGFQQKSGNSDIQQQLNHVYEVAEKVNDNVHSMGCALSSCHRPDGTAIFDLPQGEMEIGVGIHGERGISRTKVKSSDEIATILIDNILAAKQQIAGNRCKRMVLLTNNLGSVSGLEMGIVHRKAISYLREEGYEVCRAYCGTYMTSLDMRGISLTLLTVVDEIFLELLDIGGDGFARADWKPDSDYLPSSSSIYIDALRFSDSNKNSDLDAGKGGIDDSVDYELMSIIKKVCQAGVNSRETLNELDRECGDGDAGDTLATACNAILKKIEYFSVSDVAVAFRRIALSLTDAVGGTSGPLYAVFFIRAAYAFGSHSDSNNRKEWKSRQNWVEAIQNGISGIEELGECSRGDRTLLDALYPVYEALKTDSMIGMDCLVQVAKDSAENTRNLEAKVGRARYVEGKGVGKVDPGAYAVYLLLKALLK